MKLGRRSFLRGLVSVALLSPLARLVVEEEEGIPANYAELMDEVNRRVHWLHCHNPRITFPNGSMIKLAHPQDPPFSQEYEVVVWDDVTWEDLGADERATMERSLLLSVSERRPSPG